MNCTHIKIFCELNSYKFKKLDDTENYRDYMYTHTHAYIYGYTKKFVFTHTHTHTKSQKISEYLNKPITIKLKKVRIH